MMGLLDYSRGRVMGRVGARFQAALDERVFNAVLRRAAIASDAKTSTGLRDLEAVQRLLTEKLSRMDISAPVSGIVYGLAVFTPQSVIRAAEPILFLIPQDRPLVISARVPTTDIDQVYVGQDTIFAVFRIGPTHNPRIIRPSDQSIP